MDPVLCNSCGYCFPSSRFTEDERQALLDRHYLEEFTEELRMLQRVQDFYRRHPEADGTIKSDFDRLLTSQDVEVQEQLFAGVPFNEIAPPSEELPAAFTETYDNAGVIEYLRHNSFSLGPRLAFVAGEVNRLEAAATPVQCPWCQAGTVRVPQDNRDAFSLTIHNSVTWYWPGCHSLEPDGTLHVHCSGWAGDSHWNGSTTILPEEREYPFWQWLVEQRQFRRLVDEKELPAIQAEWSRQTGNNL